MPKHMSSEGISEACLDGKHTPREHNRSSSCTGNRKLLLHCIIAPSARQVVAMLLQLQQVLLLLARAEDQQEEEEDEEACHPGWNLNLHNKHPILCGNPSSTLMVLS